MSGTHDPFAKSARELRARSTPSLPASRGPRDGPGKHPLEAKSRPAQRKQNSVDNIDEQIRLFFAPD